MDGCFTPKTRRGKTQEAERNYVCGCQKSYLSYPALYTHVKNKHNGTFLVGSIAKRRITEVKKNQTRFFTQSSDIFSQELGQFLEAFPKAKCESPISSSRFVEDCNRAVRLFPNVLAQEILLRAVRDKTHSERKLSTFLASFLEHIHPLSSEVFFRENVLLCLMLIANNISVNDSFPIDLNNFIAEIFPQELKKIKDLYTEEPLVFLGIDEQAITYLLIMCRFIGDWLFHNKQISFRVEFNITF